MTDRVNCGACRVVAQACVAGERACARWSVLCGEECIDSDAENCGACGHDCGAVEAENDALSDASCRWEVGWVDACAFWVDGETRQSCDDLCAEYDLLCYAPEGAFGVGIAYYENQNLWDWLADCGDTPEAQESGWAFTHMSCHCTELRRVWNE